MFHTFLSSLLMLTSLIQGSDKIEFSFGAQYSSYILYMNDEDSRNQWSLGGEIAVHNFIPNIGLRLRGSKLKYDIPVEEYIYEYIPLTLCTSFNILPFLKLDWLRLSLETGFGLYLWKGFDENGAVIEFEPGEIMDEKDIGFVGGFTLQVRPFKFIAIEYATRYNYIASADIYKYGFDDKDEKLWENSIGLKIILP